MFVDQHFMFCSGILLGSVQNLAASCQEENKTEEVAAISHYFIPDHANMGPKVFIPVT